VVDFIPSNGSRRTQRFAWLLIGFFLFGVVAVFPGCDSSSSTRSSAKEATSGDYEILVTITQPVNNSRLVLGPDHPPVTLRAEAKGGVEDTYGWTWIVEGGGHAARSFAGESDGDAEIVFEHSGLYKITVIVKDINGITGRDSINVEIKMTEVKEAAAAT
jgi:hypothetical protein